MHLIRHWAVSVGLTTVLCIGCSTTYYKESADREASSLIKEKTPDVPNMDEDFTINELALSSLEELPVFEQSVEFFGEDPDSEKGHRIISLVQALDLAVKHNRNYQREKEILYLEALSLSLARYDYTPIFSSGASADYRDVQAGVDDLVRERSVGGSSRSGADLLLRAGGRVATSFTSDFLRFIKSDTSLITSSSLAATLVQPLWRGAGYRVAMENLTQAERNLLYGLRRFTRFRKEFSVDTASSYYNVLQARDRIRNEWATYQNAIDNTEREKARYEEGKAKLSSLGQFEQQELSSQTRWINALRLYRSRLDAFKIQMGLSIDSQLVLDDAELVNIGIEHPDISMAQAIELGMVARLDLYTIRDQEQDALRKITVAADGLDPRVDLVAGGTLRSRPGSSYSLPDLQRFDWSAGLDVELPFDQKAKRNRYRAALITYQQAKRRHDLEIDLVKTAIKEDWRALDTAKRNYEISESEVKLSERRMEEQQLLHELGRGTSRDMIEAQQDLTNARNARTSELVNHTISRLSLWRDMGIFEIADEGQWKPTELNTISIRE